MAKSNTRRAAVFRSRAGLVVAAVSCVMAGGIALFASGREWVRFTVEQAPLAPLTSGASGHVVAGAATPLSLVVLAGVVAFPATRAFGRRTAGLLVALAGAGLMVTAIQVAIQPRHAVAREAARLTGRIHVVPTSAALTAWPWVMIVLGAFALGIGFLTAFYARHWPAMGRRYESGVRAKRGDRDDASMWDRLDRGDDPTI